MAYQKQLQSSKSKFVSTSKPLVIQVQKGANVAFGDKNFKKAFWENGNDLIGLLYDLIWHKRRRKYFTPFPIIILKLYNIN